MGLALIDWILVAAYFVFSALIGVVYARRAGRSTEEFFLSGRNLPWWLAGTSMVATTFAADTPLAVTELVAKNGIAGNWLWWNMLLGGMLTVFLFARLWRRAGIVTDVELTELRYSGRPAAFLRGFRAVYLGLFINAVIMGWVNVAMAAILQGMFGIPRESVMLYVGLALALTAVYSALSGLWGVAMTDLFQFVLAMGGTIVLAFVVLDLPQIGGIDGLVRQLPDWTLRFTPVVGDGTDAPSAGGALALTTASFLAFIAIQWWASWYPGAEPGGGGYIAQRMMSARDEKHSLFATLWFTVAHYCLRPWPWIIVGLATLVLYPDLPPEDKKLGYVYAMRDHLPAGLRGALVAAFFAAYMSTIATQLNWGTSYIVNDLYRRFISPVRDFVNEAAAERNTVFVSRVTTLMIMIVSLVVTALLETISGAWAFIIEAGAGLGLVLILRWYWWRVNAWSELAAMFIPLVTYGIIAAGNGAGWWRVAFPESLYVLVGITTAGWLAVTWLTPPTDDDTLKAFYRRVHPGGPGWRRIARLVPEVRPDTGLGWLLVDWVAGVVLVYGVLFGTGKLIFGFTGEGLMALAAAAAAAAVIWYDLARRGARSVVE